MAITLLHYAWTHNDGRCLVVAPMKSHVELIYQEILRLTKGSMIWDSLERKVTSPQYAIEMSNGSTIRFFTSGIRCLTPDHDVLTYEGWKPIAGVEADEKILSWKDGQLLWSTVATTYSYEYEGKMLEHKGRQLSFRCTPNHRFRIRSGNNTKYRWVDATELKHDQIIPGAGFSPLYETEIYSADEMELWGWWLSEGSGFIGNCARFSQKKPIELKRMTDLIEVLGYKYKVYQYGDKAAEIRVSGWKPPIYSGTNCFDKFIPRELLNEKYRASLLTGLLGGDGYYRRKGWEYSSSSQQLVNDVQELAVLEGFRTLLRSKQVCYRPVGGGEPNPHWVVSAYPYDGWTVTRQDARMEWVDYKGPVHCLEVPETGTFIVRHNGAVHVTGNSGGKADVTRGQEAHIIILDELDLMHSDDLESIYAMLQRTAEDQPDKLLIGASTPTGRREQFWKWCTQNKRFKEIWFPSYVNPFFNTDAEEEFRVQYSEMGYRHEIEADWGEDTEGVYPRRFVDRAFIHPGWRYVDEPSYDDSFYVIGVDWDKYGAGTNIVVLEVCSEAYRDERFANRVRLAYREETKREEYSLTKAVQRIIQLNEIFQPRHIYVDRGFGEVQVELLHKFGVEHPFSQLRKRVKGISFSEAIEVRDPHSKELVKKDVKPFMVDNLRQMLEAEEIVFPENDEDQFPDELSLYKQLISYVVVRTTQLGRPVYEASGSAVDHAHDALLLACLAITQNYGELMKVKVARKSIPVSNEAFLSMFTLSENESEREAEEEIIEDTWGSASSAPIMQKRSFTGRIVKANMSRPIQRRTF